MPAEKLAMPESRPSFYSALSRLSAIITIIPASMAAGWMFGHYVIDRYLGSSPWAGILFILIGAGAGFYEITRILTDKRKAHDTPSNDMPSNDPS